MLEEIRAQIEQLTNTITLIETTAIMLAGACALEEMGVERGTKKIMDWKPAEQRGRRHSRKR